MAGRLDLKGCFDPEEDLGISKGYMHIHTSPFQQFLPIVRRREVFLKASLYILQAPHPPPYSTN
jgi:hypothetical protein